MLDITERKRNEERQRLLMAELDHRVKNILGNVSAIARLSSNRARIGWRARGIARWAHPGDLPRAWLCLRRGAWEGANLAELADEALSPFRSSGNIELASEPVRVVPELAQSLALILHELATNALKHGALSTPRGRVKVLWSRLSAGQLRFVWQEFGGPRASPPTRKGFGLTILQTAAADLGAIANFDFAPRGSSTRCRARSSWCSRAPPSSPSAGRRTRRRSHPPSRNPATGPEPCRILVVEDEALVALQLQNDLEQHGYHVVGPARSLKHGLLLAAQERLDAAFVDISLGRDTSAAIADQLLARDIPFVFATGYSETAMLPEHLREIPKLSKPYGTKEICDALGRLIPQKSKRQNA